MEDPRTDINFVSIFFLQYFYLTNPKFTFISYVAVSAGQLSWGWLVQQISPSFFYSCVTFFRVLALITSLFLAGGYLQEFPLSLVTGLMCAESDPAPTQLKHSFRWIQPLLCRSHPGRERSCPWRIKVVCASLLGRELVREGKSSLYSWIRAVVLAHCEHLRSQDPNPCLSSSSSVPFLS